MHQISPIGASNKPEVKKILKIILVLNILVASVKFFIGLAAGSLSIVGDAVHSSIDSLNNIIALFMIKLAAEPPDKKHHYGHAKFETLGALTVVAFLAIASFELVEKSITRLFNPQASLEIDTLTIVLLAVTLVINLFVWLYEKKAADKYQSQLLMADAAHTFSDVLVTASILVSVFFISRGYLWLDPALGLVIAAVILHSGWEIIQHTVPILVDEAWLQEEDIGHILEKTPKVIRFHSFRSRKVQEKSFIEMSVVFDTDSLSEAHKLSHQIEDSILQEFGQAEVTIHIEPR